MAGHSKWANIKRHKAVQDAKRGKAFGKAIREITVAAKINPDPAGNPRLRHAVEKALAINMTKDTIERAIARGSGGDDGDRMEEVNYEGYAAGGIAIIVETLTDNRNRTVAEVRHLFSKHGGNLGNSGSVAFLFQRYGQIIFESEALDTEALFEAAIEAGAEDVIDHGEAGVEVLTKSEDLHQVREQLAEQGYASSSDELIMRAHDQTELAADAQEKLIRFMDAMDDLDDVQSVYCNARLD